MFDFIVTLFFISVVTYLVLNCMIWLYLGFMSFLVIVMLAQLLKHCGFLNTQDSKKFDK